MQTWILLVIVQISRPPGGLNMSISAILGRGPSTAKIEPPSTTYHVDLTRQQIPSLTPLGQRILQVMASCGSKISDPSRCTKAACFSMMFSDSLRCGHPFTLLRAFLSPHDALAQAQLHRSGLEGLGSWFSCSSYCRCRGPRA